MGPFVQSPGSTAVSWPTETAAPGEKGEAVGWYQTVRRFVRSVFAKASPPLSVMVTASKRSVDNAVPVI